MAATGLTIEGVRPKPDGLTASLSRASGGIAITQDDMVSLQSHGHYFSRDGRLVSNEGELQVSTKDGVIYLPTEAADRVFDPSPLCGHLSCTLRSCHRGCD